MTPSLDTFRGCLLGGALGDALGYPVEFINAGQIAQRFPAGAPEALAPGEISDDTQMTLFTAEGLLRAKARWDGKGICHTPTVVAFALLRWYETQGGSVERGVSERGWLVEERRLHALRAPGTTCMSGLRRLAESHTIPTVDAPPNHSKGCGAVMRAAPCGLAASTPRDAWELARDTGVLTHGHPSGYLSGAYLAALVWHLARGTDLSAAMTGADELLAGERGADELQRILARTRELGALGVPEVARLESLGGGWTGDEALAIALLCALTFDPTEPRALERTLWRAAAHSGDSDSTASIAGNLLGTTLGYDALPQRWLATLELRDVIDRIAADLHASFAGGRRVDYRAYPGN